MPKIIATTENVDQLFEGVMIPREHTEEPYTNAIYTRQPTPGWKCKACGWTIGSEALPPSHYCNPGLQCISLDNFVCPYKYEVICTKTPGIKCKYEMKGSHA
jgi:hypothetical protein